MSNTEFIFAYIIFFVLVFAIGLKFTEIEITTRLSKRAKVIQFLKTNPGSSAYQIAMAVGIINIYPTLVWMENNGTLMSDWEAGKYPRRRLYWVREP